MTVSVTDIRNSGLDTPSTTKPTGKSALGKEDFLKLLVAQLSNQDPLKPTEGAEFVAQLAQFSNLEQAIQSNATLSGIKGLEESQYSGQAVNMIGKTITARGDSVSVGDFGAGSISANPSGAAASVNAKIYDSTGNLVRTVALGALNAGGQQVAWDGKDNAGSPLAKGTYTVALEAKDASGKAIAASSDVSGMVTSVAMKNGVSTVRVGNTDISLSNITSVK